MLKLLCMDPSKELGRTWDEDRQYLYGRFVPPHTSCDVYNLSYEHGAFFLNLFLCATNWLGMWNRSTIAVMLGLNRTSSWSCQTLVEILLKMYYGNSLPFVSTEVGLDMAGLLSSQGVSRCPFDSLIPRLYWYYKTLKASWNPNLPPTQNLRRQRVDEAGSICGRNRK